MISVSRTVEVSNDLGSASETLDLQEEGQEQGKLVSLKGDILNLSDDDPMWGFQTMMSTECGTGFFGHLLEFLAFEKVSQMALQMSSLGDWH